MSKIEKDKIKKLFYSNKNFDILKNIIGDFVKKNFDVEISSKYDKYIIDTMKKIYKNKPENKDNLSSKAYNQLLNKTTLDETLLFISKDISSKVSNKYKINDRPVSSNLNKEDTNKSFEEIISNRRQSLNNIPKPIDFSDPVEKNENTADLFLKEQKKREEESKNIQQAPSQPKKKLSGPKKPTENFTFNNQILSSIEEEPPKIETPLEPVAPIVNTNNSLDTFIDNESTDEDVDNLEPASNSSGIYADFSDNNQYENFDNQIIDTPNVQAPISVPIVQQNNDYKDEIEKLRNQFGNIENQIINNKLDSSIFEQIASINNENLLINRKLNNLNEVSNNNITSLREDINRILNILVDTDSKLKERDDSNLTFISTMLDKSIDKLVNKLNPKKELESTNLVLSSRDRDLSKYEQLNNFQIKLENSYLVKGLLVKRIYIPDNHLINQTPINFIGIDEFNWKDSMIFNRNTNSYDEFTTGNEEYLFDSPMLINNLTFRFTDMFGNLLNFNNNLHKPTSYIFEKEKNRIKIGYDDSSLQNNDYIKFNNFKFNNDTVIETIINSNEGYKAKDINENTFSIESSVSKIPSFIGSFIIAREQIYISIDLII